MKKVFLLVLATVVLGCGGYLLFLQLRRPATPTISAQEAALGAGSLQSNRVRVLVGPDDPARGPAGALVTLIAFSDFQSPACKRTARTLFEATLAYPAHVRVVFKPFPRLDDPNSVATAEAALAAAEQGRFWEMHDLLFLEPRGRDRAALEDKARALGLDMTRFRARLAERSLLPAVEAAVAYAEKVGVRNAPALFLNGLRMENGALPFVELKLRIDAEIAQVRALVADSNLRASEAYGAIMREARVDPPAGPRPASLPDSRESADADAGHP